MPAAATPLTFAPLLQVLCCALVHNIRRHGEPKPLQRRKRTAAGGRSGHPFPLRVLTTRFDSMRHTANMQTAVACGVQGHHVCMCAMHSAIPHTRLYAPPTLRRLLYSGAPAQPQAQRAARPLMASAPTATLKIKVPRPSQCRAMAGPGACTGFVHSAA